MCTSSEETKRKIESSKVTNPRIEALKLDLARVEQSLKSTISARAAIESIEGHLVNEQRKLLVELPREHQREVGPKVGDKVRVRSGWNAFSYLNGTSLSWPKGAWDVYRQTRGVTPLNGGEYEVLSVTPLASSGENAWVISNGEEVFVMGTGGAETIPAVEQP